MINCAYYSRPRSVNSVKAEKSKMAMQQEIAKALTLRRNK